MKKLVGAITGCIAAYYVIDVLAAVSMACAWDDLVKYGHMQAAHEPDGIRFDKENTFEGNEEKVTNRKGAYEKS